MKIGTLVVVLVLACGNRAAPPEPTARLEPVSDASIAVADAAVPFDAPVPVDAAVVTDAAMGPVVETVGTGRCKVDTDCVLSNYQAGCCVQGCQPFARNGRDLERAIAAEQATCEAFRKSGELCPPPAPCRRATHRVLAAKCVKGRCTTVSQKLTP